MISVSLPRPVARESGVRTSNTGPSPALVSKSRTRPEVISSDGAPDSVRRRITLLPWSSCTYTSSASKPTREPAVALAAASTTDRPGSMALVTPAGYRIEGLTLEDVKRVVRVVE